MTASMAGYEPVSKTVATVIAGGTQTPDTQNVNFKLNGSGNDYYLTWNDMGYSAYQVRIYDDEIKVMSLPDTSETTSLNLLHFIPCADESKAYDIVLREQDGKTILARLEDAMEVTVSGSKAEYSADFSATGVTAIWTDTPSGKGQVFELKNNDGQTFNGGGTPVSENVIVNADLTSGGVLDLRVITDVSLDGQVLSATITPASEATYVVEGQTAEIIFV